MKTVFLAHIFAKSFPFTSKLNAERSLVKFMRERDRFLASYGRTYIDEFNACIGKEDFNGAVQVWNKCIRSHWNNNSLYLAEVSEVPLDGPVS